MRQLRCTTALVEKYNEELKVPIGELVSSSDNETTPLKLVVDMAARSRKPTRKYIARRRNGHYTSPNTPKRSDASRISEVPLHKVKRKLHFGRKPPRQRNEPSTEKRDRTPQAKADNKHTLCSPRKKNQAQIKPKRLSKELWDLLEMADNFIWIENMRAKNSHRSCACGDYDLHHRLHSSPENTNLSNGRQS